MCGYCLDGPPCWIDADLYINTGQVDSVDVAAVNLHLHYWSLACEKSKVDLGRLYRKYGLNWRDNDRYRSF